MDGWYALALSICKNYNPDTSISIIETGSKPGTRFAHDDTIPKQMIDLRSQGCTWQQIGDAYSVGADSAYRRVKRYQEKAR